MTFYTQGLKAGAATGGSNVYTNLSQASSAPAGPEAQAEALNVHGALSELGNQINGLSSEIGALEDRLHPVLRLGSEGISKAADPPVNICPVVNEIISLTECVNATRLRLNRLISLLQV
jgi:hypothetical protein